MDKNQEEPKYRNFTSFKLRAKVLREFNISFEKKNFVNRKEYKANEFFLEMMDTNFNRPGVFGSEYSTCEAITYPILAQVSKDNELPIWSHYKLESPKANMTGEPDYLFAFSEIGDDEYSNAIVCVGEAKKDDFVTGWAQVSAEMVAAQKLNNKDDIPVFGLVTTGSLWQFAVLKEKIFTLHKEAVSATENFQKVLDCLNWIFFEAKKNADILEELDNK